MLFQHELSLFNCDCGKNNTFRLYVNNNNNNTKIYNAHM